MADSPAPSFRAFLERVPPAQFTDPATALPPARGDEDSGDEDNDNSEVAADDPPTPSSSLYSEGVWPHFDATLTEPEPDPVSPPTLPRPVSLDAIEREIRRLLILQQTTSLRIEAGRSLPLTLGTSTPDLLAPRPEEGDGQEPDTPARTPASLSRARTRKKAMHTLGLRRGGNSGDIHMRGLPYRES